jgi:hypothetical protein
MSESVKHQAKPMCKASSGTAHSPGFSPGENFLYGFKGAQSAPRALAAAHAKAPREVGGWPIAAHQLS